MKTHINDLKSLRDSTPIGAEITFKISKAKGNGEFARYKEPKRYTIKGIVTKKYDHIFYLDDGKCYQWVDYLIGRRK